MFERILVPLDGSKGSEKAIPVAARIARASGGTIVFVSVVLPPVEFGTYSPERKVELKPSAFVRRETGAASYLTKITDAYAKDLAGINTIMDVSAGAALPEIYSTARFEGVDLIVLCSHKEGGLKRWIFGSAAQEAMHHSPVPVLVLDEHGTMPLAPDATHPLRMLVPLDGSIFSERALQPAAQLLAALAEPFQGEVHLLDVVDLPSVYGKLKSQVHITDIAQEEARQGAEQEAEKYMKSVTERLQAAVAGSNLTVTSSVKTSTHVAGTIIHEAEQSGDAKSSIGYHMIAMATHGRGGLSRLLMGSVTEHVLGTTQLPLLIVRPEKAGTKGEEPGDASEVEITEVEINTWVGLL